MRNCINCPLAIFNDNGDVICPRRDDEGIEVLIKKDKLHIECHARYAEVWDEKMIEDDDGEFIFVGLDEYRDREIDMGYLEENTYGIDEV